MSKQINRTFIITILIGLLALSVVTAGFSPRVSAQRAGVATAPSRHAAIVAATAEILKETSEIRELSIKRDVKSGAQSRADIERMIVRNLDEDTSPAEMHATEVLLKAFGLAPKDFRYRPFVIKLLAEQVAGYYDPKAQQFYLADWIELEGQKPVMAHELTHALQDQHFNLRRFEKWPKGDSDAELAAHALIEGDAVLAMSLYMARHPQTFLALLRMGAAGSSSEVFDSAPRVIRESLTFPYTQGFEWSKTVYRRGGWKMISDAFTNLPQSSEQIMHPEKYFSNEAPVKVVLPEFKSFLGTGWKRIDSDVNGEWGCYLLLDEFIKEDKVSKRAAAGWAGDRFAVYEDDKTGQVFTAQLWIWDSENDAAEFFNAYQSRSGKRYPDAKPVVTVNDRCEWSTPDGKAVMERRGARVLILEGMSSGANVNAMLRAGWQ